MLRPRRCREAARLRQLRPAAAAAASLWSALRLPPGSGAAAAEPPGPRCEFVGGTASSAAALRDPRLPERTIVIQLWGAVFDPMVAWRDWDAHAETVQGVTGSYAGLDTGWDALKTQLLPTPPDLSLGLLSSVGAEPNATDDAGKWEHYDLLVLNLTAVPAYEVPGVEILNATLPAALIRFPLEYNLTCSNEWVIAPTHEDVVVLESLFTDLHGEAWTHSDNWLDQLSSPCQWYGVQCDWSPTYAPGRWGRVQGLYLAGNNLVGEIPSSIRRFANLMELHMEDNELNGTLPEELGELEELRVISLARNRIAGTLPAGWQRLQSLREVVLFDNALTGTIPAEWGNLTSISTVLLHGNDLSGRLPDWARWQDPARPPSLRKVWAYDNPGMTEAHPSSDQTALEDAVHPHSLSRHSSVEQDPASDPDRHFG